jgi:hypothetical protein
MKEGFLQENTILHKEETNKYVTSKCCMIDLKIIYAIKDPVFLGLLEMLDLFIYYDSSSASILFPLT